MVSRYFLPFVCFGVFAVGCSSDATQETVCEAGRVIQCPCPTGELATQTCLSDGTAWGVCGPCGADLADGAGWSGGVVDSTAGEIPHDSTTSDSGTPFVDQVGGFDATTVDIGTISDGVVSNDMIAKPPCTPCGYGSVKGIVCSPSEQVFVTNATVTISAIDCDGKTTTLQTVSGADGSYYFPSVPCGLHKVYVVAGSFTNDYTIEVQTDKATDISGVGKKQCFKAGIVPIAVFWGQWDHQHDLLELLGFDYTWFDFEWEYFNDVDPDDIEAVQVLRDPTKLAAFRILFFNCGSAALNYVHSYPEIKNNLKEFVLAGGSIYASDLSWAYIEAAFPDSFDFYGTDDLPSTPMASDGPQQAVSNVDVPATIVDPTLKQYVGVDSFVAKYGPGPLIAIEAPGPGAGVHVTGMVQFEGIGAFSPNKKLIQPVVVSHVPAPGAGRVVYTTFHNDEQADAVMLKLLFYMVFLL
ncbi:MAG: carboxypeptidase regulatory-like domain-containing protein [Myxococcales bacterium]|nr:carboxypeptidase regulatory-like domain-containing protein [Myxococcales bacterium]